MPDEAEFRCSKECSYLFDECKADGTRAGECRTYYNDCVEACTVTWPERDSAVPV
jgi:hypothetical protein